MEFSKVKRATVFFILFFLFSLSHSQPAHKVSGRVIDSDSRSPLAFVNVVVVGTKTGGTTDIDGKFTVYSPVPIEMLKVTYVGYYEMNYAVPRGQTRDLLIRLKQKTVDLSEVIIYPTVNPAHRIINNVIANRDRNDPEKLKAFSYTSYERTILTAELDTLNLPDSLKADTNLIDMEKFLDKQDFAIMESVVERKFMAPDKNYENVVANRVSGFQDPIFVFLISQVQSTTFYKDFFHIADKYYVNPISKGSTSKYIFLLQDTLYTTRGDSVFIISYQPRPNTNFDALEGLLYINTRGWAIQNVIARPAREEAFSIKIQQQYELVDSVHWFPVQLNTDVIFNFAEVQAGEARMKILGIGKSYIRDIEINPELVRRQFATLGVDVEPDASDKPDEYWEEYRIDSLTDRDRQTYAFMDSIGKEANFDRIAKSFETMFSGKIPVKFIDIDLDKILKYNGYQGIYLGLGAHTNERVSRFFKVGGYWGYGFKIEEDSYGGDVEFTLNRRNEVGLKMGYYQDFTESGGVDYQLEHKSVLTGNNWGKLLITRMYPTESFFGNFTFRALRDFKFNLGLRTSYKRSPDNYRFGITSGDVTFTVDQFDFTEASAAFRFAFREEFITTKRKRISLGSRYPVVFFTYTHGLKDVFGGDFSYNRYDLKVEKSFYARYLGKTTLQFRAGIVDQPLPECNLYNGNGSRRLFTIFAPYTFGAMRMNEFLSDRYVALYFSHNFGKLLHRSERFRPELVIFTNAGFGWLKYNGYHYNISYKTMEKGYYESGFLVNNLLNLRIYSIGLGAFYRYGPYSFGLFKDNLAIKFSLVFPLDDQ